MMLEADVVIGTFNNSTEQIPIMAHPPANSSDLSLKMFLDNVLTYNNRNDTVSKRKGVKLDFKSIEALENSTSIIQELYNKVSAIFYVYKQIKFIIQ